MYVCIPACSQIWARVIQGCRDPCLGALLCREEATSDRACSTRLAAIDVAWTEPGGRESNRYTSSSPRRYWLTTAAALRQPCATTQGFNSAKHNGRFRWVPQLQNMKQWNLERLVAVKSSKLWAHIGTVSCSCTKAFNQSTRCNTQCYGLGLSRLKIINLCTAMHKHRINLHSAD